jgi:hypothetical protein
MLCRKIARSEAEQPGAGAFVKNRESVTRSGTSSEQTRTCQANALGADEHQAAAAARCGGSGAGHARNATGLVREPFSSRALAGS